MTKNKIVPINENEVISKDIENEVIRKDGESYTIISLSNGEKVEFRHPKGRDIRFAMGTIKVDADLPFIVTSNATCKTVEELDEMPAKDLMKILKVATSFLV